MGDTARERPGLRQVPRATIRSIRARSIRLSREGIARERIREDLPRERADLAEGGIAPYALVSAERVSVSSEETPRETAS